MSFLKSGEAPQREYIYWELHEGTSLRAVRFGDWKAVCNAPGKALELYDLKTDASEKNDLAQAHPEVVAKAESIQKSARTDHPGWPLVAMAATKGGKTKVSQVLRPWWTLVGRMHFSGVKMIRTANH